MQQNDVKKGLLIVLSGPSGVGKGTINKLVREKIPSLANSISVTTRTPRAGEVDGQSYFFETRDSFEKMIENDELLEWAEYVGNYYGTPRKFVEDKLNAGIDVLLEIETQGALQIKSKLPQAVCIFLSAPSEAELEKRIRGRGTESEDKIQDRLNVSRHEMTLRDRYDYEVINEEINKALEDVLDIIKKEHLKNN